MPDPDGLDEEEQEEEVQEGNLPSLFRQTTLTFGSISARDLSLSLPARWTKAAINRSKATRQSLVDNTRSLDIGFSFQVRGTHF